MARRGDGKDDAGDAKRSQPLALPLKAPPPTRRGIPALLDPPAATPQATPAPQPAAQPAPPPTPKATPQSQRPRRNSGLPYLQTMSVALRARDAVEEPAVRTQPGRVAQQVVAGRYLIEAPIGEGAMGQVFRVRHLQLGRPFALKLIQVGLSGTNGVRERFYREARLASQLVHPNVVSVVDFGEDEQLGAFMVMELVEGDTLSRKLESEGRFGLRIACDVVMQIAEALHYVHTQQVVHGDIKPDNVLVCKVHSTDRRRLQLKLLDFGIARVLDESRQSRSLEGTPAYLSPEKINGLAPQPSMDLYSLGVMFFELLTGRLPFVGGVYEVLTQHATEPPPRPSDVLGEAVDERAEALILRALEKDPANRHRDMNAFIYELRTLMEMHGMRRRTGAIARVGPGQTGAKDRRQTGMVLGYELAPLAMAALDLDGTVVACNRAFAAFLTGDESATVEGQSVLDSDLTQVCPDFAASLKTVAREGQAVRLPLVIDHPDRKVTLALYLIPGAEEGGHVHMYVHPLGTE